MWRQYYNIDVIFEEENNLEQNNLSIQVKCIYGFDSVLQFYRFRTIVESLMKAKKNYNKRVKWERLTHRKWLYLQFDSRLVVLVVSTIKSWNQGRTRRKESNKPKQGYPINSYAPMSNTPQGLGLLFESTRSIDNNIFETTSGLLVDQMARS